MADRIPQSADGGGGGVDQQQEQQQQQIRFTSGAAEVVSSTTVGKGNARGRRHAVAPVRVDDSINGKDDWWWWSKTRRRERRRLQYSGGDAARRPDVGLPYSQIIVSNGDDISSSDDVDFISGSEKNSQFTQDDDNLRTRK